MHPKAWNNNTPIPPDISVYIYSTVYSNLMVGLERAIAPLILVLL